MVNLLILSPDYSKRVNWGHQHVRDALLEEVENSIQYGEGCAYRGKLHIPDICEEVSQIEGMGYPDVILMENWKNMRKYTGAKDVGCLKAYIVCDYFPDNRGHFAPYNEQLNKFGVDIAFGTTPDVVKHLRDQKVERNLPESLKTVWIPQGVNTDIFYDRGLTKEYDVMAVFGLVSYVYPERPAVQSLVSNMKGVKSLVGEWRTGIKHFEYAEAINKSKIFVCSNGLNNQVLMKYFEVMASGTFLLTNLPNRFRDFGFQPGVHFAVWKTIDDLRDKIYHFLSNDYEREEIAREGKLLVTERYNTGEIARQIHEALALEVNGRPTPVRETDEKERTPYETGFIGD